MRTRWLFLLVLLAAAPPVVVACSEPFPLRRDSGLTSEPASPDGSVKVWDGARTQKPPVVRPPPSAAVDAGAVSVAPAGAHVADVCTKRKDTGACFDCCDAAFPNDRKRWEEAHTRCACAPARCATECVLTMCATPQEPLPDGNSICSHCLETKADDCAAEVQRWCATDAECSGMTACLTACESQLGPFVPSPSASETAPAAAPDP